MNFKRWLNFFINLYTTIKEEWHNGAAVVIGAGAIFVGTYFGYPAIGLAVSGGVLVAKSIYDMIKNHNVRKGIRQLYEQTANLLNSLDEANEEITELKDKMKARKKNKK